MADDPRDLTTVELVEAYLVATGGAGKAAMDTIIQGMITGASQYWLNRTGQDSLNSIESYSETYDGSGSQRQYVRNGPIVSIVSVLQDGVSIPTSTNRGNGYLIDGSKKCIVFRGGYFCRGVQNIEVSYTAGYNGTPADIQDKCTQMVAINFKRRSSIDQGAQMMPQAGGTNSYRSWAIPPEVEACIQQYTRRALV